MLSFDDRSVRNAHLFVTAFVIVVCGVWMASVPYGSLNFVYEETGRNLQFRLAKILINTRGFGLVCGVAYLVLLLVAWRRRWQDQSVVKLCWIFLGLILCWFTACIVCLWPAMRVVFSAGLGTIG